MLPELTAFADDKLNINLNIKIVFHRVENIVVKGEKVGYHHFLLFPQCFKSAFSPRTSKDDIVWWRCQRSWGTTEQQKIISINFKELVDDKGISGDDFCLFKEDNIMVEGENARSYHILITDRDNFLCLAPYHLRKNIPKTWRVSHGLLNPDIFW